MCRSNIYCYLEVDAQGYEQECMELSEEQQSGIIEVVVIIKGYKQPGEQQPLPPLFLFFF